MQIKETTADEARRLRAAIYGDVSDATWVNCSGTWTTSNNLEWLRKNQPVHFAPCPPGMHWKKWCGHADAPTKL